MRILIVSDAWFPQVNGVVRTLDTLTTRLRARGYDIGMITPDQFRTIPCPSYPEIRLALTLPSRVGRMIDAFEPSAIHIATEGPLGFMARRHCLKKDYPFTTAYHTRFPEYINARLRGSLGFAYKFMRWFHRPSRCIMVATQTIEDSLKKAGFSAPVRRWSRGVNTDIFHPRHQPALTLPKPVHLYVGRVAVEKNIEDFLKLNLPGSKLVVGDGPQLEALKRKYPNTHFVGARQGEDLARHYASADLFVFPSRTDTFGLVLLEALATGLPVAAYPVPGPLDVIGDSAAGCLDEDLGNAVEGARATAKQTCLDHAAKYSWDASIDQFLGNLSLFGSEPSGAEPARTPQPAPHTAN